MLNVRPIFNSGTKIQYHTHNWSVGLAPTVRDKESDDVTWLYSPELCGSSTLRKVATGDDKKYTTKFPETSYNTKWPPFGLCLHVISLLVWSNKETTYRYLINSLNVTYANHMYANVLPPPEKHPDYDNAGNKKIQILQLKCKQNICYHLTWIQYDLPHGIFWIWLWFWMHGSQIHFNDYSTSIFWGTALKWTHQTLIMISKHWSGLPDSAKPLSKPMLSKAHDIIRRC